jgi:hypothetical protein
MASKGILVSDPSLHDMNPTRWAFEYAGIVSTREQTYRTTAKVVKDYLIHFLGLDMVPPSEDTETGEVTASPVEYLPLVAFMNPRLFQSTMEKRIKLEQQNRATEVQASTADAMGYDEMLENFEDLVPVFDEIFEGVDEKLQNERLEAAIKAGVLVQPPPDSHPPLEPRPSTQKKATVQVVDDDPE